MKIEKKKLFDENEDEVKLLSRDDVFKRANTERSMTVKLKTVKTSDLDL